MLLLLVRKNANETQIEAAIDAALVASIFKQEAQVCLLSQPSNFSAILDEKYQQLLSLKCKLTVCPSSIDLRRLIGTANQVLSY